MDETKTHTTADLPVTTTDGKDELNLAEFPLSCISDRSDPNQKTLTFEDKTWDEARGQMITRRLTITGSDKYGLPTALDDELLLGLIQLSKFHGFAERRVQFTRYQLIRLLDWRDESKSYSRIEMSLNRWMGVTLYYDNAWRDRSQKRWVNEKFHVLDNVTLYERNAATAACQPQLPLSSFVWNDVLFRSFRSGNLKSLDFDFFKRLESSIAKRLFRFLDKRFFHRRRWEFDLKEFSWEHIGLARSYDAAGLKRKLTVGIVELERNGFLLPLPAEERFRRVVAGQWRVIFEKATSARADTAPTISFESQTLIAALVQRQVTPSTATETVSRFSPVQIRSQLEVFDWLMANKDTKVSKNPPGFLISAIRGEYMPPKGFVSRAELDRRAAAAAERKRKIEDRKRILEEREAARSEAERKVIQEFWNACSQEERRFLEAEALAGAEPFDRNLAEGTGSLALTVRQRILDHFALRCLQVEG